MAISIYVGNLPWSATEDGVRDLFSAHGEPLSVKLISDRETGRARGFGSFGHGFEHAAAPTRLQVSRQTLAWQRCGSGGINRHGKAPRYKKLGILPTPVGAPPQAVHNGLSIQ